MAREVYILHTPLQNVSYLALFLSSHSGQSLVLVLSDSFPASLLSLSFSQHFLVQNDSALACSLDYKHGRHHSSSGTFSLQSHEDLFATAHPLSVPHPPAIVPGEIPALAGVEDGSSGRHQLHREKGERKTCVVFPAFTLAEKNACKTGAGVQPSEFWKLSKASPSQERTHGGCVWL